MRNLVAGIIRRPEWLVAIAMVALPFDTWKVGPAGIVSLSNIAFMLVAIAVVLGRRAHPGWSKAERLATVVAVVFAISFLPSALFAEDRAGALRTFLSLIGMGGAFLLVILSSSRDASSLAVVLYAWLVGGLTAAAGAIAQYVLWLFGITVGTANIAGLCSTPFVTLRAEGLAGSPNYLGFFALPVAVVSFGLLPSRPPARWLGAAAATAASLTVLLTYSRGAIGSLAVAASAGLCLFVFSRTRHWITRVAFVGVALIALVLLARLLVGFNAASLVARENIIFSAVRAFGANPLSGTGLGSGVSLGVDVSGSCDRIVITRAEQSVINQPTPSTNATSNPAPVGVATSERLSPVPQGPGQIGPLLVATILVPGLFFISAAALLWRRRVARYLLMVAGGVLVASTLVFMVVPSSRHLLVGVHVGPRSVATTTPRITDVPVVAASSAPSSEVTTAEQAIRALGPSSSEGPTIGRRDTHVTILQAAADAGAAGLLGYLVLVLSTLWFGTRSWATRSPLRTALVLSAIAVQVAALVTDALSIKQLYVDLALVWAIAAREVGRRSENV